MSEERPQEQDPTTESANSPTPETSPEAKTEPTPTVTAQPAAAEVVSAPDNSPLIGERLQQFWQKAGPIVLLVTIGTLRVLSSLLTSSLNFLEKSAPEEAKAAPTVAALTEKADPVVQKAKPVLAQLWQLWLKLLQWLRSIAPANWQRQLNSLTDNVLTGLIVGALLLVFWFWGLITPDQSPAARKAAKRPPEISRSVRPQATSEPRIASKPPSKPLRTVPSPAAPSVAPTIAAKPAPAPKPKPSPVVVPSPKPSPVAVPSPSNPPVAAKPSSEQTRLAGLRPQLAKVGNTYADGLVQDLSVNPGTGSLRVQLKDKWYDLSASQQDQLAQELLQNSTKADFSKLELADAKNRLIARSPLVGTEVIILRRSLA